MGDDHANYVRSFGSGRFPELTAADLASLGAEGEAVAPEVLDALVT
jgi:hypothetical protein